MRFDILINDYRVFPRLMMIFMMYMMINFHNWFTVNNTLPVTEMSDWALIGYGSVLATFVGFAKFYMETRGDRSNPTAYTKQEGK